MVEYLLGGSVVEIISGFSKKDKKEINSSGESLIHILKSFSARFCQANLYAGYRRNSPMSLF